ncbi:MAG: BlaI/MecI/CopY family transcriptional regulator [Cytophagales bacterium]|nr:MAG: BlaI/MecI/CopY family transcriptional regulator [Cytophagales bacterium]
MTTQQKPTDSELEILQILWKHPTGCTVRFVNDELNKQRPDNEVGYTTTLKMMQIMAEKQLLLRDESQRTHVYMVNVSQEKMQQSALDKVLNSVFGGSAMKLVMQALGNQKTSKEELNQIRSLLDEIEQKQKGGAQ